MDENKKEKIENDHCEKMLKWAKKAKADKITKKTLLWTENETITLSVNQQLL